SKTTSTLCGFLGHGVPPCIFLRCYKRDFLCSSIVCVPILQSMVLGEVCGSTGHSRIRISTMCEEDVLIEREELNIYHVVIGQNIMLNRAFLSNH
ncbi:hypothetical protein C0J52_15764, partial [Blattella germanica]